MSERSLVRAAGEVLVVGYPREGPTDRMWRALGDGALGGVILFKRNVGPLREVAAQLAAIAATSDAPPLIAIDQEGGRVQRLGPPVLQLPPMSALGAIDDPTFTRTAARVLGRQLAAIGINTDFAPVLDVFTNPANTVIGDRAFGTTPAIVARHGRAFAEGLADSGVLACGKHFPGHGDTVEDSHFALPALDHSLDRLRATELAPFAACADAMPSIMTAHIVFRALDPTRPATLSRRVITELLRGELGYDGLVVSDDLEMKAIADRWPIRDASVLAIEAGCDVLLICQDSELYADAHAALLARAQEDDRFAERLLEAAARVARVRTTLRCAPVDDPEAVLVHDSEAAEVAERLASR